MTDSGVVGRTGRFGRKGCSVIFVHDDRSRADVEAISATLGKKMKKIDARSSTDLEQLEKVSGVTWRFGAVWLAGAVMEWGDV